MYVQVKAESAILLIELLIKWPYEGWTNQGKVKGIINISI